MKKFNVFLFVSIFALLGVGAFNSFSTSFAEPFEDIIIINEDDFITKLSNDSNYNGKNIILGKDLDFSGYENELNSLYSTQRDFSGVFDGNGFTINNITFSSVNQNYGLFTDAHDATIKNVRFGGKIKYNLANTSTQIFMGAVLGYGDNVTITDCEIAEDTSFFTAEEVNGLEFSTKITYGAIVGAVENGSNVLSCINYSNIHISSSLSAESINKVGGFVGRCFNSNIRYCANYGDISFAANSSNITFYNGGIVGEVEGDITSVVNNAFNGNIVRGEGENYAGFYNGAVVGSISSTSYPASGGISFDYWTNADLVGIGKCENASIINPENVKKVSQLSGQFFMNKENWHSLYPEWDFERTFVVSTRDNRTILNLQRFKSFIFNFSSQLDTGSVIESATFVGGKQGEEGVIYRYGENVVINIAFKSNCQGYYSLSSILLDANTLSKTEYVAEQTTALDGSISGYQITLSASAMTDGYYSFDISPITFDCVAETSNIEQGGLMFRGGYIAKESLPLPLTLASNQQIVVAQPTPGSIYTFASWDLYYFKNGEWTLESHEFSFNPVLTIEFGTKPFDRKFKIVANFTDKEALVVKVTCDDNVSSVVLGGINCEEESIKVSSTSQRVELLITVNEGYELDMDRLIAEIQKLYGDKDTSTVFQSANVNENNQTEYKFAVNMKYIKDRLGSSNEIAIGVYSNKMQSDDNNNLLWLWILIPVVGVLLIGGIVLFFVIRNIRYKHGAAKYGTVGGKTKAGKAAKEKPKKDDFKDFYY